MSLLSRKAARKAQRLGPITNEFRTTVFYTTPGPEVVAVVSAMGFGTLTEPSPEQSALAKALMNMAQLLAADRSAEPANIMLFAAVDGSGRLLIIFPSDPAVIIAQIGIPVVRVAAVDPDAAKAVAPGGGNVMPLKAESRDRRRAGVQLAN